MLIVGSGVMGQGIAWSFASHGIATSILSRFPARTRAELLRLGRLSSDSVEITVIERLPPVAPSLIIESIPEKLNLKVELLEKIAAAYFGKSQGAKTPIVASNTSSLSLQALAYACPLESMRNNFCGIHYFQPAEDQLVVEFSRVAETEDSTQAAALKLLEASDKEVVVLQQPIQGLLLNRLQHAIYREVYHLIESGVVTAADVDLAARRMLGPRMCVTGLLEQKDIAGLDTHSLSGESLVPELNRDAHFSTIVSAMRETGTIGVKSKLTPRSGFYDWAGVDTEEHKERTGHQLRGLLEFLKESNRGQGQGLKLGTLPLTPKSRI